VTAQEVVGLPLGPVRRKGQTGLLRAIDDENFVSERAVLPVHVPL
jgi:hypothetical protein